MLGEISRVQSLDTKILSCTAGGYIGVREALFDAKITFAATNFNFSLCYLREQLLIFLSRTYDLICYHYLSASQKILNIHFLISLDVS